MAKALVWLAIGLYGVPFIMKYVYVTLDRKRGIS